MGLTVEGLRQVLVSNVVELKFSRKNLIFGRPPTRRMLASLNLDILNSDLGRSVLNFKPPTHTPAYNASSYNLLVVFDLFMQDWRAIPANNTEIINILPSKPEEFWEYFNNFLSKMTSIQKATFMDI